MSEPAAGPEPGNVPQNAPQSGEDALRAELEATRASLSTQLEETRATAAQAGQRAAELEAAAAAHAEQLTAAQQQALAAHRRAALAENRGSVIDELVTGSTPEEIDASIETAKAAYARVVDAVRATAPPAPNVPPGASPRAEPNPDELSPLAKITGALNRNGK